MKPLHWICSTVLLSKSFQVLWSQKASHSNCGHCSQPNFWFHQIFFVPAAHCSATESDPSAMARQISHFFSHKILKGLGSGHHTMDVIVAGQRHEATEHVIYFGGDVQDYPENMMSHRDNGQYVAWNLLSTAERLVNRFPKAMVLVVKPHYMHLKTFSVYSQFVQSNDFGIPHHTSDFGAWKRLVQVYKDAVGIALKQAQDEPVVHPSGSTGASAVSTIDTKTTSTKPKEQHSGDAESGPLAKGVKHRATNEAQEMRGASLPVVQSVDDLPEVPVNLIGFSRGCIVLNQLLYELEAVESGEVQDFISRIHSMTWLDGGHSGGSNTWVTDPEILQRLAALNLEIRVHVTPYQVKDEMRRWIGKEKRKFVELLQKNGAKVTDSLHFENEPKSIDNHFRVLEVF